MAHPAFWDMAILWLVHRATWEGREGRGRRLWILYRWAPAFQRLPHATLMPAHYTFCRTIFVAGNRPNMVLLLCLPVKNSVCLSTSLIPSLDFSPAFLDGHALPNLQRLPISPMGWKTGW